MLFDRFRDFLHFVPMYISNVNDVPDDVSLHCHRYRPESAGKIELVIVFFIDNRGGVSDV